MKRIGLKYFMYTDCDENPRCGNTVVNVYHGLLEILCFLSLVLPETMVNSSERFGGRMRVFFKKY